LVYFDKRKHTEVAKDVAKIAEKCYGPITKRLGHEPAAKTHIIILDTDDYSNGFADSTNQRIVIWLTHMDISLRGTHRWLETVIPHEFTHIVHLDIMSGLPRRLVKIFGPGFPGPSEFVPSWFIEGLAQDTSEVEEGEYWDSHRDMILRSATLENKLLTYNRMGVYGKNGLGNEMVYNQGYSLTKYLKKKHGEEGIASILEGKGHNYLSLKRNMYYRVKDTPGWLYKEWKEDLEKKYKEETKDITPDENVKDLVSWGWSDRHPTFSPTKNEVAFVSNKGQDYERLGLYLLDLDSKKHKRLARKANPDPSFSYDGEKLVYSRNTLRWQGSFYGDLYLIDLTKVNKKRRLTRGMRAKEPHLSPDGKSIVFVKNEGGRTNICLFSLETEEVTYLTKNEDYTQYFTPSFSPDGKRIVFSRFKDGQRDICFMCADGLGVVSLPNDGVDDRDPSWSRDGKRIIFSSDRTGIFNIYELNLETKRIKQLTNVIGGAFEPSYSFDEKRMVFSSYSADGYDIKILDRSKGETEYRGKKETEKRRNGETEYLSKGVKDKKEEYPVRKYRPRIRPILWFPMGLSVMGYAQDVMGKHIFEGAIGAGGDGGVSGYAYYLNRRFLPNILIGAYDYSLGYTNYIEGPNRNNLTDDYWERRRGGIVGAGFPIVPVGYLLLDYEAYFVDDIDTDRDINPPNL
ncbi:PD40 domain-containing protein, partial [bacterium]|nr:PD40 domain-containing protein [bacterium]